jgi:hypothetical protein
MTPAPVRFPAFRTARRYFRLLRNVGRAGGPLSGQPPPFGHPAALQSSKERWRFSRQSRSTPGWALNLVQKIYGRPRPELKIYDLVPDGGGTNVDFNAVVANPGNKTTRATVTARVAETPVHVLKPVRDLVAGAESMTVPIRVPRPELGDLFEEEFGSENATSLYGRTLTVELADEKRRATRTWREHEITPEENPHRRELQQRLWRIGRGEATEDDRIAERQRDLLRRNGAL